jgi:hypothetical protein
VFQAVLSKYESKTLPCDYVHAFFSEVCQHNTVCFSCSYWPSPVR